VPIATGETFAWPEGQLVVYASASGATTGSGVGFAENARLSFTYGWYEYRGAGGTYRREITGQVANLSIGALWGDTQLFQLLNASAALNAVFRASAGALTQSAHIVLYSGVGDSVSFDGAEGQVFKAAYNFHCNTWSGFGQ
jgi:hypothetical protein